MTPERWKKLDQIVEAALDLEPEDRPAFIDSQCGGDAELCREARSLIAQQQNVSGFLASPAIQDAAPLLAQAHESFAGRTISHYQVIRKIAAGGMGEVYLAEDTELDRKVALKILPAEVAANPERMRRFVQEAKTASALNHPNILTIYEIEQTDSARFIATELVDGETLRERMQSAPMKVGEVLDVTTQIASALVAAHAANIVHRDIKPENIMLRRDGIVKVLDFGLAKLTQPARRSIDTRASTLFQTEPGRVMGTVAYMSPEQVCGLDLDARTDIWSLGVVLYELLAGHAPFTGETSNHVAVAILEEEPTPLGQSAPNIPSELQRIVRKALAKDRNDRFQSVRDLLIDLRNLRRDLELQADDAAASRDEASDSATSPLTERAGKSRLFGNVPLTWLVAAAMAVVAALALAVAYFRRVPAGVEPIRFSISVPKDTDANTLSISPDGRLVAFIAASDGKTRLWVRPLGSFAAQPLTGTEDAKQPFWSPDSRAIGFFGMPQDSPGGKLKRIDVSGGPTQVLCGAQRGGGTWNRDGVILLGSNGGVQRVSATGGEVAPVTTLNPSRQETGHWWPYFLPDGRHFLYLAANARQAEGEVYLASLDERETKRFLLAADSNAVYAPPGYLLFLREGTLLGQPFGADQLQLTGEPMRIAEQVQFNSWTHRGHFSVSDNGVLVYYSGVGELNPQLGWFDRAGKSLGLVGTGGGPAMASLSPDEKRVAFSLRDPRVGFYNLWLLDLVRGTNSRFTTNPANDFYPIWSPDGSRIVWSGREELWGLYQKVTNGTGQDELLLKSSLSTFPTDWSADGRFIVYQQSGPKEKWDLWVLPLDGERKPSVLLQTEFNKTDARFSPDVKWLAYTSDLSGSNEVYVQNFPAAAAAGGRWTISTKGGSLPRWRRNGKELFYVSADQKLMAVEVKGGASFEAGAPKVLFDLPSVRRLRSDLIFFGDYNVAGDGQRFLLRTSPDEPAPTQINVVVNWTAELKRN